MDGFDYEARVNCPVSGEVWEDVLRRVAVWSVRVDLKAERLERVCKKWWHYWRVALGVFSVDLYANRIPKALKPLAMHKVREAMKQDYLVWQFRIKEVSRAEPPVVTLAPFIASWPTGRLGDV